MTHKKTRTTMSQRTVITNAVGSDLPLLIFREEGNLVQYAGLWGAWWLNEEISMIKVILITVEKPSGGTAAERTELGKEAWRIMQMHAITPDHKLWPQFYVALRDQIDSQNPTVLEPTEQCRKTLAYKPDQNDQSQRCLTDPDALEQYTLTREDGTDVTVRPQNLLERQRVMYTPSRGKADNLKVQPFRVFIDNTVPSKVFYGPRRQSETGLFKVSNLLAAVNEWKTWIVL